MATLPSEEREDMPYYCPVCGAELTPEFAAELSAELSAEAEPPRYDAPCHVCRSLLWCPKRMTDGIVILDVIPGRTPEHAEVIRLAESLERTGRAPRVIVDLSRFELLSSAFVSRLVMLNKGVKRAKGRLVLCGLRQFVRETFVRTRLDTIIDVLDDEKAARASLQSTPIASPA